MNKITTFIKKLQLNRSITDILCSMYGDDDDCYSYVTELEDAIHNGNITAFTKFKTIDVETAKKIIAVGREVFTYENDKYKIDYNVKKKIKHRNKTITVYRIKARKQFTTWDEKRTVHVGDYGGWVEHEYNLHADDKSWIFDDAIVIGKAEVAGNAIVQNHAIISGGYLEEQACVSDHAMIFGGLIGDFACVYDNAIISNGQVSWYAHVFGHAYISGGFIRDHVRVFGNAHISGGYIEGHACVYGNAHVLDGIIRDNAHVYDNAHVLDGAIRDNAHVYDNAKIFDGYVKGNAHVYENACVDRGVVCDNANVYGDAIIEGRVTISKHGQVYGCAIVTGIENMISQCEITDKMEVYGHTHIDFSCIEMKTRCDYRIAIINGTIENSTIPHDLYRPTSVRIKNSYLDLYEDIFEELEKRECC